MIALEPISIAILTIAVVSAAYIDITQLRIPNLLVGLLAAAFPVMAFASGTEVYWWSHLLAFAVVAAGGIALFAFRLFGGGDVKLIAVLALWFGFSLIGTVLFWIAVAGLAIGLAIGICRISLVRLATGGKIRPDTFSQHPVLQSDGPVPYGLAILCGTVISILTLV